MKTSHVVTILIVIGCIFIAVRYAPSFKCPLSSPTATEPQRYLLFQGTYAVTADNPSEQAVFKIDTTTGKVWKYEPMTLDANANFYEGWRLIKD